MKTSVVTGAGAGIARKLAARLAGEGQAVALLDLNEAAAEAAAEEIRVAGGTARAFGCDVRNEDQIAEAMVRCVEQLGPVDTLVNAAGGYGEAFRETHLTPLSEWEMVIGSNLTGTFLCAKHVLPGMMERRSGVIVNFASNAGRSVSPLLGASYTAAKTGVIGLTRHLAHEYGRYGIRVNTLAPGPVEGARVRGLLEDESREQDLAAQIPLGRLAKEEDVVDACLYLLSDQARFVHGAILDVNGGYVLP